MRRLLVIALVAWAVVAWGAPAAAGPDEPAVSGQARPEVVAMPGLAPLIRPSGIHWTPADPLAANGAKGTQRQPQNYVSAEPNPALMGRADLYRSVPLPDPGFEFKSGPAAGPQPPQAKPEQGVRLMQLPLAFSAGTMQGNLGAGEAMPAPSYDPAEQQPLAESEERGGFLALRWRPDSSLGLDLGGGYQRGHDTTGGGEGLSWQMASPAPLMSMREPGGSGANYLSYGRWAAFMALPYQLSDNLGLRPEVSYYHGDNPDLGRSAANEWVMGLQFTFGF